MAFKLGQPLEAKTTVERDGTPVDASSAEYEFRSQAGAITKEEAPEHPSTGTYAQQFTPTESGTWWLRFVAKDSSGDVIAVDELPFEVEPTHFP